MTQLSTRQLVEAALGAALFLSPSCLAADWLPLQTGNEWRYRHAESGQEFTIRVGDPVWLRDERLYYSLTGYTGDKRLVRRNPDGDLVYLDEDSGQDRYLTLFQPFGKIWWNAPGRGCEQEGQTQDANSTHDGPAGPFHDALDIRYRSFGCADTGVDAEQYADNIGLVRRTVTTLAGPRTYDLVYARVGSIHIDAGAYARFHLSVNGARGASSLQATLRLQTNSPQTMNLTFPTAQEFELRLTDSRGNVVWQWSDGRVFDQAEHKLGLSQQWTTRVDVPKPRGDGGSPVVEVFTLEAWMTTNGTPRFASSLLVPITLNPE